MSTEAVFQALAQRTPVKEGTVIRSDMLLPGLGRIVNAGPGLALTSFIVDERRWPTLSTRRVNPYGAHRYPRLGMMRKPRRLWTPPPDWDEED